MNLEKYFILNWKKVGIVIIVWVLAVILHNIVSALLNIEEAAFFILAVFILPLYLIIAIIYTIYNKLKKE